VRFVVLGAGAIGGYVGAMLARSGADVTLIARGQHLQSIQDHGIRVVSPLGDFSASPVATDSIEAAADADVVFLGLKAYSLPGLAAQLGNVLNPATAVIAAQNGIPWWYFQHHYGPLAGHVLSSVDPGGMVSAAIAADSVIGCVVYPSTEIVAPGVIKHVEGRRFTVGEPSGERSSRCEAISDAFVAAGFKCPINQSIRDEIWLKLVGNAAFNTITALTGATLAQLGELPEMIALLSAVMEECAAVASALGVTIPVSIDRRLQAGLEVGDHKTSMLQDVEAGKPLEIDCMTGAVIEIAERLAIPVPHTRTAHVLAKLLGMRVGGQLSGSSIVQSTSHQVIGVASAPPTNRTPAG
jgi:2-dehydropantoate 2-reductase